MPTPPPQGQNSVSNPCGGFLPQKWKTYGLPGFAKPWADQCFNPPALLTAMDAPLAFGMIGDFSLGVAEEIPIPVSIQILTSSHVFWGGLPPVFRRIFALCPVFTRRGDTYPAPEEKGAHSGNSGFYWFYSVWVVCVLQVCFQLQKQISQALQRFFAFAFRCIPATQQRQKNTFQLQAAVVPHFCHGRRNADSAVGATAFPLLPHLPHIIFTRLPLRSVSPCACPNTLPAGIFR